MKKVNTPEPLNMVWENTKENQKMLAEISHRDNLLSAVNSAASVLLTADDEESFITSLLSGMEFMGCCVHADRVYIMKNEEINGEGYFVYHYEWTSSIGKQGTHISKGTKFPHSFDAEWLEKFLQGECLNGPLSSLSPNIQKFFSRIEIKSVLVMPIFIREHFWGLASFSDCLNDRTFTQDEINILRSGVLMMVNAINRNEMTGRLAAALEEAEKAGKMAREASRAKSSFLASMSHEIRTPMNAIIGMTQIAAKTSDVEKLKYCLSNIENSSTHLLGIINDILDMSKIEAGKLELDHTPLNIEKMLIKVCNIMTEKIEQKDIKFNIVLGTHMRMHYLGDELRLSQVITNLLSNAVKFTPVGGKVELASNEVEIEDDYSVLRFSVRDTGIGMTEEQISRLFTAFEQAESSTTRKFGGTGLGLAISKSIVEKMDGRIWVESEPEKGSAFIFDVKLERPEKQNGAIIYGNVRPSDIKLLIVDPDSSAREYLKTIIVSFGITADEAANVAEAVDFAVTAREMQKPYDIVFVDYALADKKGIEYIQNSSFIINKKNVILMTSFINWNKIEAALKNIGISRFIPKPLFPSSILNIINEVIGGAAKNLDITSGASADMPDFSDITLLVAEDVEINREILIALLEDTKVKIDVAENGLIAVEKFRENPDKYDIIIMDVQMPEMDGLEASRTIRSLNLERAKNIPIIAMTANVFTEDIDNCIKNGMTDHLSKPIELDAVIKKILSYCRKKT